MNKQLQNLNQGQIIVGLALTASAVFSAYNVKTNMDIIKRLDEINEDMEKMKQYVNDNQRKNNISIVNLGRKLEEVQFKFANVKKQAITVPENNLKEMLVIEEVSEEDDENVEDMVNSFLKN
jgi:hypothetical protein